MKSNKYAIRDRKAGNIIDEFPTAQAAISALKSYERTDKKNGEYTENFYQIVPIVNEPVRLYRKNSGNYAFAQSWMADRDENMVITSPAQLKSIVNNLPDRSLVIVAEYSRSNRYTSAKNFSHRDALNAFGFSATKADIFIHFNL